MLSQTRLPAICAAAAILAGCGGGSGALSKSDLISQGNAICLKINNGIKGAGPTNTAAAVAAAAPKISVIELEGVSELRKLKPPSSIATAWGDFLSKIQKLSDEATKIGAAARSGDQSIISSVVTEAASASTDSQLAATKVGLTECARSV